MHLDRNKLHELIDKHDTITNISYEYGYDYRPLVSSVKFDLSSPSLSAAITTISEFMDDVEKSAFTNSGHEEEKHDKACGASIETIVSDELPGLPTVDRIVLSGPATVVLWSDGTKTVSKLHDGDKYDPLYGILACIIRKLTKNRGHGVDSFEGVIGEATKAIRSVEDVDGLIEHGERVLGMLRVLRDSKDAWLPHLGGEQKKVPYEKPKTIDPSVMVSSVLYDSAVETKTATEALDERVTAIEDELKRQAEMRAKMAEFWEDGTSW